MGRIPLFAWEGYGVLPLERVLIMLSYDCPGRGLAPSRHGIENENEDEDERGTGFSDTLLT